MRQYGTPEVERLLGIPRAVIKTLVEAGFVAPERGPRNAYRFSFQDLVLLRTAQGLSAAKVPPRRIKQSLERLRRELPADLPLSGIRVSAHGTRVIVHDGAAPWRADTGQYLLDFALESEAGAVRPLRAPAAALEDSAQTWFERACGLEQDASAAAEDAYRQALKRDPKHLGSAANLGNLLHETHRAAEAEQIYRAALELLPDEPLLYYNLGTVLEDTRRIDGAIDAYDRAVALDPEFADAHYNLARLHEQRGEPRDALRHLAAYRRLER